MADKWNEYNNGTLTPPAVVQHDELNGEHLVWVWTGGKTIIGPLTRTEYNETEILMEAVEIASSFDVATETPENKEVATLKTAVATLTAENTTLKAANAALTADKIALEKQIATAASKTVEATK